MKNNAVKWSLLVLFSSFFLFFSSCGKKNKGNKELTPAEARTKVRECVSAYTADFKELKSNRGVLSMMRLVELIEENDPAKISPSLIVNPKEVADNFNSMIGSVINSVSRNTKDFSYAIFVYDFDENVFVTKEETADYFQFIFPFSDKDMNSRKLTCEMKFYDIIVKQETINQELDDYIEAFSSIEHMKIQGLIGEVGTPKTEEVLSGELDLKLSENKFELSIKSENHVFYAKYGFLVGEKGTVFNGIFSLKEGSRLILDASIDSKYSDTLTSVEGYVNLENIRFIGKGLGIFDDDVVDGVSPDDIEMLNKLVDVKAYDLVSGVYIGKVAFKLSSKDVVMGVLFTDDTFEPLYTFKD